MFFRLGMPNVYYYYHCYYYYQYYYYYTSSSTLSQTLGKMKCLAPGAGIDS